MLSQAICNTAFTFIFCLCRAWRSARGESLGYSLKIKPFLSMCIVLGIRMVFLIPCFTRELLKAHVPRHISFLKLFLPRPSDLSCLSSLLPQAAKANTFAFKCFYQMLPGKLPQTWECSELGETKASLCAPVLQGTTRKIKIHNHNSLRTRSVLPPQVLGTRSTGLVCGEG